MAQQPLPSPGLYNNAMLRIIGGEFRSRHLIEPGPGESSRPYLGQMREAVCNILRGWFEDARVLDLFAGVGTMGLETVSRGAAMVVMVEKSRDTFLKLKENIEALGCGDRARAIQADALSPHILAEAPRPVDLLFVDPPYELMEDEKRREKVLRQMANLLPAMAQESFAVLRSPIGPEQVDLTIDGWAGPEPHFYGTEKWILLYEPTATAAKRAESKDDSSP